MANWRNDTVSKQGYPQLQCTIGQLGLCSGDIIIVIYSDYSKK